MMKLLIALVREQTFCVKFENGRTLSICVKWRFSQSGLMDRWIIMAVTCFDHRAETIWRIS